MTRSSCSSTSPAVDRGDRRPVDPVHARAPLRAGLGLCDHPTRAGRRVVVSGDTGPNEALVQAARGADLFVVEATLLTADEDDPMRGHLTVDEALDMGERAGVGQTVLVHYRARDREAIDAACRRASRRRWPGGRAWSSSSVRPSPEWKDGQPDRRKPSAASPRAPPAPADGTRRPLSPAPSRSAAVVQNEAASA